MRSGRDSSSCKANSGVHCLPCDYCKRSLVTFPSHSASVLQVTPTKHFFRTYFSSTLTRDGGVYDYLRLPDFAVGLRTCFLVAVVVTKLSSVVYVLATHFFCTEKTFVSCCADLFTLHKTLPFRFISKRSRTHPRTFFDSQRDEHLRPLYFFEALRLLLEGLHFDVFHFTTRNPSNG